MGDVFDRLRLLKIYMLDTVDDNESTMGEILDNALVEEWIEEIDSILELEDETG